MSSDAVMMLVRPGVHFMSPGLLQLSFRWHIRWIDDLAAVCPDCCCMSRVGRSTV